MDAPLARWPIVKDAHLHLALLAATLVANPLLSGVITSADSSLFLVTMEEGVVGLFTSILWVFSAASVLYTLALLSKGGRASFLEFFSLTFAWHLMFTVGVIYIEALKTSLGNLHTLPAVVSGLGATAALLSRLKGKNNLVYTASIFATALGLGVLLNLSLNPQSVVVILVVYSLLDPITLRSGPTRTAFRDRGKLPQSISPLVMTLDHSALGIGDIIVYSVLLSFAYDVGLVAYGSAALLMSVGFFINLWALRTRDVFPAVPIPTLLALAGVLVTAVLSQV